MRIHFNLKKCFKNTPKWWQRWRKKYKEYRARRPHRSFRLTRRRDYVRNLTLPGYFSFTHYVTKTLWRYKNTFLLLGALYVVLFGVLIGWESQSTYSSVVDSMSSVVNDTIVGDVNFIGEAGLLLVAVMSSITGSGATELQQGVAAGMLLLVWLTTVWLLRNLMAGHRVKLRDGLYNAGAPIVSTALVALLMAVQLLPVAIAVFTYNAASSTGLLESGIAAMLFWLCALLLTILSLYWWTSSIFALVIVTLPGMYPYRAIKTAGDLVLGVRVRIVLRWLWMGVVALLAEALILLPAILIDMGLRAWLPGVAAWLPVVPFVLLCLSSFIVIWIAAYVYLLYRKVVDNETSLK